MDSLEDLRAVTASLEQSSGYTLFDAPLALSPPLAPTTSPVTSPPPALLASSSPLPPTRTVHRAWSDDEIDHVLRLFHRYGPKFRQISRHVEPSWKNPGFRPGTEDLTEIRGANSTALFGVWAPCSPTSSSCAPTSRRSRRGHLAAECGYSGTLQVPYSTHARHAPRRRRSPRAGCPSCRARPPPPRAPSLRARPSSRRARPTPSTLQTSMQALRAKLALCHSSPQPTAPLAGGRWHAFTIAIRPNSHTMRRICGASVRGCQPHI